METLEILHIMANRDFLDCFWIKAVFTAVCSGYYYALCLLPVVLYSLCALLRVPSFLFSVFTSDTDSSRILLLMSNITLDLPLISIIYKTNSV